MGVQAEPVTEEERQGRMVTMETVAVGRAGSLASSFRWQLDGWKSSGLDLTAEGPAGATVNLTA